ncbi:hypothetical protein DL93DRAFT_1762037 [Clavulina sp. PMI_390]|nr:hypothetical protein DL93DRAFT_1762037 [Clavulina sp. PMI_390]
MAASSLSQDELFALNRQRPAVSLFPELLVHIFTLTVRSWAGAPFPHQFGPHSAKFIRKTRFTLAAVCTRWREVVLSTQSLWNVIMISIGENVGFDSDHLLTKELGRSGDSLLSLLVTEPFGFPRSIPPEVIARKKAVADTARQMLPRCKNIIIHSDQVLIARMLSPSNDMPASNLQSLSISSRFNHLSPDINLIDLTSAVGLRDLRLNFNGGEHPIRLNISPQAALHCLDVSAPIASQDIVDMVARSHSLEEFTWYTLEASRSELFQTPLPSMPYLVNLVLYGQLPLSMLPSFRAPQLMILEIMYRGPDDDKAPTIPFPKLASISFPGLRVLYVDGHRRMVRKYEPSLVSFLKAHPTLQVVSLPEHTTEPLADAISNMPCLSFLVTSDDKEDGIHAMPLIRRWYAKSIAIQGWRSPILRIEGVYYPNLWEVKELKKNPGLLEFAQKIVVDTIFWQRGGPTYWDAFLSGMESQGAR